jgi:hypothetical protein
MRLVSLPAGNETNHRKANIPAGSFVVVLDSVQRSEKALQFSIKEMLGESAVLGVRREVWIADAARLMSCIPNLPVGRR